MDKNIFGTLTRAYVLTLLGRGAEVVFFIILLSVFSVEQVGVYGFGVAVSAFFAIALDLGLSQVLVRDFSKKAMGVQFAIRGSLIIRIPIVLIGLIVLILWNKFWGPDSEIFWVVVISSLIQVIVTAEGFSFAWLKSNSRQTIANVLSSLDPIGRLIVLVILYHFIHVERVLDLLLGIMIWHIPVFMLSSAIVWRELASERDADSKLINVMSIKRRLLWPGMVFGLIGLITVMQNRMDWLMISHYAGQVELANYSVANKAYEILMLLSGITMVTLYPSLCRNYIAPITARRLNLIMTIVLAGGATVALGGAIYLPEILGWVWGDKYQSASDLVRMLLPVAVLSISIMILYYRLISKGMEGGLLKAGVFVTLLQLGVNVIAIPRYGAFGAIIGMAALSVMNLAYYALTALRLKIISARAMLRQAEFILAMLIVSAVLHHLNCPMPLGLLLICVFCVFLWFIALLDSKEQKWVIIFTRRKLLRKFIRLHAREV